MRTAQTAELFIEQLQLKHGVSFDHPNVLLQISMNHNHVTISTGAWPLVAMTVRYYDSQMAYTLFWTGVGLVPLSSMTNSSKVPQVYAYLSSDNRIIERILPNQPALAVEIDDLVNLMFIENWIGKGVVSQINKGTVPDLHY